MKTLIWIVDKFFEAEPCSCGEEVGATDYDNLEDWMSSADEEHGTECAFAESVRGEVRDEVKDHVFNSTLSCHEGEDLTDPGLRVFGTSEA